MTFASMVAAVERVTARHVADLEARDGLHLVDAAESYRSAIGQLTKWDDEAREHIASVVTAKAFQAANAFADVARGHVAAELGVIADAARRRANGAAAYRPDREALRTLADGLVLRLDGVAANTNDLGPTLSLEAHQVERIVQTEGFAAYNAARDLAVSLLAERGDGDGFVIPTALDEAREARDARDWVPGIVKRWSATLDKRLCPRCERNAGEIRILAMAFNGEPNPPLHPQCRCFVSFYPIAIPRRK